MFQMLAIIALAAAAVWIFTTVTRGRQPSENRLLSELIAQCMGDASQAERLIEYERKRLPNAPLDRAELIARAIRRLERDKHR